MQRDAHGENDEERWSRWMARAQAGDREAYRSLLTELAVAIEGFVRLRLGAALFVEDCVQESLLSIHRAYASYDPRRPFRPWLFAIVRRRIVDCLRRESRGEDPERRPPVPAAGGGDPTRRIDGLRLLDRLPDDHREALLMTKFWGHSIQEAAERAGVSRSAMKTRVHRAIRAIERDLHRDMEAAGHLRASAGVLGEAR